MSNERIISAINHAVSLLRHLRTHYMSKADAASSRPCKSDAYIEKATDVTAAMEKLEEARDWLKIVREYKATFCDVDKHGEVPLQIELQALSAQNMADCLREMYGANVKIIEICEIKDDWK